MTKTYQGACPVCHAATQVDAEFLSVCRYTTREGEPGIQYPALTCASRHTVREVRKALGLPIHPHENPEAIVPGHAKAA